MNLPQQVLAALGGQPLATVQTGITLGKLVPNVHPTLDPGAIRLAIIGEAPGEQEEREGKPFVGASGKFLSALLAAHGIAREQCLVANVCNYRPPGNELRAWPWSSEPIQDSLIRLKYDLDHFKPNCCLLLGGTALYAATREKRSIYDWRGSIFRALHTDSPLYGHKCIASFHPALVLRQYDLTPLLRFDIARARDEAQTHDLSLPVRRFERELSLDQIIEKMARIVERAITSGTKIRISFDLEGYWNRITRFSIAEGKDKAFIVPITSGEYGAHWSPTDECKLWVAIRGILSNPHVRKVLQNSIYDRFVLAYLHGILISNVEHDTMLGHWELYAELPKNLSLQASLYTREPHWKEDRENDQLSIREEYCCKDSAVTEEIAEVQEYLLRQVPSSWNHFQFNMRLLNPLLYMEMRGIRYDKQKAEEERQKILQEMYVKEHNLNVYAGMDWKGSTQDLLNKAKEVLCKKREAPYVLTFQQLPSAALKAQLPYAQRLAELANQGRLVDPMPPEVLGEVESILEMGLNPDSPKQMVDWLYIRQRFERQYKEDKEGRAVLTSDVGALLTLYHKNKPIDPVKADVLKLILQIRKCRYFDSTLQAAVDKDGRMRCAYDHTGTETGRANCKASPTGSGYNLQTVTKKLRKLFLADPGYFFWQIDLAGADGWTVAAHCKALGDSTMWEDYLYGLKPAKIIARIYTEVQKELTNRLAVTTLMRRECTAEVFRHFSALTREDLKALCKEVDQDGWLYFGCKRVQHGSNYLMGPTTMSTQILKDSYKFLGEPIFVDKETCQMIKELYLMRYVGVPAWQQRVANQILSHEHMIAASGRMRRFFGRMREADGKLHHDTWKAACSNEPQDNTTYATNWALYNLWHDVENRDATRPTGLIIEPMHQVHDALNGQFPIEQVEWAVPRLRGYFNNTLYIGGVPVVIPFEGAYGASWGELTAGEI